MLKLIPPNVAGLLHMAVMRLPRSFSQQPRFINWQCFCISRTLDQHGHLLTILGRNLQSASLEKSNGKTTELQSLNAQPTFHNMLDRSFKVQFNQNAKQRLAASGANVNASNKRKKIAFAFKENKHVYLAVYSEFKEAQVKAQE